ncbi:hypothetical protein TRIATDRAFT_300061, partial [Trichoderma atroviride IMI 206040]
MEPRSSRPSATTRRVGRMAMQLFARRRAVVALAYARHVSRLGGGSSMQPRRCRLRLLVAFDVYVPPCRRYSIACLRGIGNL